MNALGKGTIRTHPTCHIFPAAPTCEGGWGWKPSLPLGTEVLLERADARAPRKHVAFSGSGLTSKTSLLSTCPNLVGLSLVDSESHKYAYAAGSREQGLGHCGWFKHTNTTWGESGSLHLVTSKENWRLRKGAPKGPQGHFQTGQGKRSVLQESKICPPHPKPDCGKSTVHDPVLSFHINPMHSCDLGGTTVSGSYEAVPKD